MPELTDAELLLKADGLMTDILALARELTPEEWQRAWTCAVLTQGHRPPFAWHTGDAALMADVRLISMRGGSRYKPRTDD